MKPLFEQKAFRKLALSCLSELHDRVSAELGSRDLVEIQSLLDWEVPSRQDDVLSVLFERFPTLQGVFDYRKTAAALYTHETLESLVKPCGVRRVTRSFQEFFESRAFQAWKIIIPLQNVYLRGGLDKVEGDGVQLRLLDSEEREELQSILPADKSDGLFFSVSEQAGDAKSAVSRARRQIEVFLAPYYLHRVRNPDAWWRARTSRQIVSPLAFCSNPQGLFGANRELMQLPTEASDLFTPDPGIEPEERLGSDLHCSGFVIS